ncbi:hypothetical protein CVD25_03450 [Bacillus canaveralius]|uniref:Uncharacterized protein n=1 Tax=Bacillus canaveralius TaxID=1403243 RepID=A0A2N5GSA6_9BACI|nr:MULTISPECIES: hypothetical protein [Bacillus]PLR86536.1 hypothetical protein CU635_01045 [Bacillus canaveralius]PLR87835.1 hypothetical protein CVD23_01275 [Bacillus sp. V33-4]PLS00307.1 hypothetical protein CVD25_03450 [Bacillus canaveralius]
MLSFWVVLLVTLILCYALRRDPDIYLFLGVTHWLFVSIVIQLPMFLMEYNMNAIEIMKSPLSFITYHFVQIFTIPALFLFIYLHYTEQAASRKLILLFLLLLLCIGGENMFVADGVLVHKEWSFLTSMVYWGSVIALYYMFAYFVDMAIRKERTRHAADADPL